MVRDFGLEALCEGKCREAERRECCYSHSLLRSVYQSFGGPKVFLVGRRDPKLDP